MSTEKQTYQRLVKIMEGIRDERVMYANTATRIGSALLELIHYAADSRRYDDIYLSKVRNDTAKGEITFEDGFVLGTTAFKRAVLSGTSEADYKDDSIISAKAVLDLLTKFLSNIADKYLRKDIDDEAKGLITFLKGLKAEGIATFLAGMAVEGLATFKDAMSSPGFWSGWSGQGWKLWFDDTINVLGEIVPKASLELDDLTVRGTFRVFEFVINQLRGENDNYVFAGMQKVDHVDVDANTIYLDTNKGETYCPFRSGDILRCQRFQSGGTVIKRYDILVKEAQVGNISDGENRIDYIVWENFDGDINGIAQGDVLCRIDNDRDPERKGIITTTSIGNGAPYIDVIYGLVTNPEESLKARLGRLDGIVNELFGELSGYGLFSNNAFLTGEFYLSTGEAVATKIKMLENLFSSSMSKTTYDIKEDDNIVTNCAFIDDMRGWNVVDGDDMDLFFIDDTPVFMNDDMFSEGHSVASLENVQGKDMLHLLNAGVSQNNALFVGRVPEDSEVEEYVRDSEGNIVKNEDGTLKTEMRTIRPTIYISYRYMCKLSGVLNIGFNNGRTTQYSSDMGAIVSVDELGTLTENVNANEGVWIERQYKGYYDKSGDFVISTTGEVYIDVLAVTSKPLNDFKNVVSTALVQTAGAIGLYGRNIKAAYDNIGGLTTSITELGVRVDAEEEKVDIFVNKTYPAKMTEIDNRLTVNEEEISLTAKTVEANETRIGQLEVTSGKISAYVAKTRTAGAELVYNNTVTIRTDENNKTATILDYIITPTFLIANVEQTITNIQIASGSDTGNPHLEVMTEPFAVKVVCDKGVAFAEPVLLEAVVTVTRTEDDVYGEAKEQTYQRSMFITVYPSTKGETGYRGAFKSTVFKRSLDKPSKPVGGSYDSPVPEGWSDGIPELAEGEENYQIWASTKVMYDFASTSDWSDPAPMTDTADFDVEFSSIENPSMPTGHPNTNTQWSNNADKDTIWMATSVCKNGVWTDWKIIKAKGEKGDKGDKGDQGDKGDKGDKGDQGEQGIQGVQGVKGDTGAGEVWQLIDNGCYASVTAEEKLTLYLAYVVVYTIDGTSVSNTNYKVYWKANNKTDWHYASNGVMLNAVDFNKDATYEETESFVVRLESNGVAVGTITVPVKLAPGAAQIITDNMIKTNVFGSSAWSSVKQTSDDITSGVYAKTADVNSKVTEINSALALKANSADLSVYAKTTDVNGIVTSLKGMGINIDTEKITISGTGNFIVETTNFKLDKAGNVTVTGTINATSGTIGGINISESGISAGNYEEGFFVLESSGTLWASNVNLSGYIEATSGTFDNCTINESCVIKGKLVGAYGQFGAWEIAAYGGYDLVCKQSVDVLFEMINTKHNTRSIVLRTTNGLSTSQGDGSTDSAPMVRVVTDNGVGGEFTANNSGGYALKAYGYNGATALYVSGLSYFSGNVSMSLYTTIPTIKGYLYRDSNGFVKIKI